MVTDEEVPMALVDATTAILNDAEVAAMLADETRGDERFRPLLDRVLELDAERDAPALALAVRALVGPVKLGPHTYRGYRHEYESRGRPRLSYGLHSSHPAARSRLGKVVYAGPAFLGVLAFFEGRLAELAAQAERRRAKRAALDGLANPFRVGDLLYTSWGYDETHYDFAQVVKVGPRSVTVRRVAARVVRDNGAYQSQELAPVRDGFFPETDERGRPKVARLVVWGGAVHVSGWSRVGERETFTETWGH